jgi:hypothetical protein
VTPRGTTGSVGGVELHWIVATAAVGLAVVPGFLDDGLVAGWVLGVVPFVARFLGPAVVPAKAFDEPVLLGFATAVLFGVVVGTVGYGIGAGVRLARNVGRLLGLSSS